MNTTTWEIYAAKTWEEAEKMAAAGWELVSVTSGGDWTKYFFKREKK